MLTSRNMALMEAAAIEGRFSPSEHPVMTKACTSCGKTGPAEIFDHSEWVVWFRCLRKGCWNTWNESRHI